MNKRLLIIIISVITILSIITIIFITYKPRLNKYVIDKDKWDYIINNRKNNNNLYIDNISFNDYNLVIDNDNDVIYYSLVNIKNKYNPVIEFKTKNELNIVINKELNSTLNEYKIMIYNNDYYHIYTLIVTDLPTINIEIKDTNKNNNNLNIEIFDNNINSFQKLVKSNGKLKTIKDSEEYIILLNKLSLGHNKRDNNISIFGFEKENEYILKKYNNSNNKKVNLFINNKYKGIYYIEQNKERNDKI